MGKLVLLSVLVAVVLLPTLAARDGNARRGLRRAVAALIAFAVFYWVGVQYFTPSV